jgi:hypothetical protein
MRLFTTLLLALTFTAACGDNGNHPKDAASGDAPLSPDGGTPDASCFTTAATDCANPATSADQCNLEIINACTTAQQIFNTFKPPLLNADGTLPPLPD